jgi:hypothetical protein
MTFSKPSNAPSNALPSLPTPIPTPLLTSIPTRSNRLPTGCVPTPYNPRALEAPSRAHSTRLPTRAPLWLRLGRNPLDRIIG